eukprot:g2617.t1
MRAAASGASMLNVAGEALGSSVRGLRGSEPPAKRESVRLEALDSLDAQSFSDPNLQLDQTHATRRVGRQSTQVGTLSAEDGGRVINLLGNHEVMNMQGDWRYVSQGDLENFGGMEDRAMLNSKERKKAWSWDGWLGSELQKFPVAVVVDRVLFVHAGLLPEMLEHRSLEDLNAAFHAALKHVSNSQKMRKDEPKLLGSHGPVWARDYAYGRPGVCKMASQVLAKVQADRMVVGHTIQRDYHVHTRCDGQILLGDTAISSVYGGEMSYMEHGDGGVKVMYPGTKESMAPLGFAHGDAESAYRGTGQAIVTPWHIANLAVIIFVLVAIWKCCGCRKPLALQMGPVLRPCTGGRSMSPSRNRTESQRRCNGDRTWGSLRSSIRLQVLRDTKRFGEAALSILEQEVLELEALSELYQKQLALLEDLQRGLHAGLGRHLPKASVHALLEGVPPLSEQVIGGAPPGRLHAEDFAMVAAFSMAQAWSENDIQTPSATDMADIARAAALLLAKISSTWDWVDVGTGTCKDASGESAFRVVLWPAAAAMREKLALPPKDFHITLGFQGCDVHSKSKGVGTLSAAPDATSLARLLQLASPLATGPEIGPFSESIELLLETALMGARHHSDTAAHVEALQTLCLYHGRLKQPSKVLVLADELLQLRSDPRGRCSRAFALVMLSRLSEALEALEAAKAQVEELPGTTWLSWDDTVALAEQLDLPTVPLVQEDRDICLFTVSGDLLYTFSSGHKQAVAQLAISPMQDEYIVATADLGGVMRVHRLNNMSWYHDVDGGFHMLASIDNVLVSSIAAEFWQPKDHSTLPAMVGLQAWPSEILMPNAVQSPKASKDPVTPRQRKQAQYASSFSNEGSMVADHQNPGDPSRQLQVSTDTQKARAAPVKVRVSLPSPRDCKATMLQGSGVVQVTDGSPRLGIAGF